MTASQAPDATQHGASRGHRGRRDAGRLEAFSDGVFAIAITLLVLEIRVPPADDLASPARLIQALAALWPSYLGYVLSFITVGIMWANHHNLLRLVGNVSHGLLMANLVLLMLVGFVPFPTALLAATLGTPSGQIGVLVYAATFLGLAVGFNILWYAIRHGAGVMRADVEPGSIASITRSYRLGPPGFSVAFIGAVIDPALGMAVMVALVVLYTLPSSSGA